MNTITVEGTLEPDGVTLRLDTRPDLPPGRVTVTLEVEEPGPAATLLEELERIHRDQRRRGQRPMTEEEMNAEIAQMRADDDEYEERWRLIWSQTTLKGPERTEGP